MSVWRGRIWIVVIALGLAGALVYAFWPQPIEVEVGAVTRGPLSVIVQDEGRTQVRDRYVVAAPLAGDLLRVAYKAGDPVAKGQVVAVIQPGEPELLDARTLAQAQARVQAAQAGVAQAQALWQRAGAELTLAENDLEQSRFLYQRDAATAKEVQDAELLVAIRRRSLEAADFARQIAQHELTQAQAAADYLMHAQSSPQPGSGFDLRSPVAGQVFRVMQESANYVAAGTEILELGDRHDLEVRIELLSDQAVRVQPGQDVLMDGWGGDRPLRGAVRHVEPSGFTKISPLGVEEQRVNVIVDLAEPVSVRDRLGDNYRVDAQVVVWQGDDVLKVPTSALFRWQDRWAVFVMEGGRARQQVVDVGQRSLLEAQVLGGLGQGDQVIVYPGDRVADGAAVVPIRP